MWDQIEIRLLPLFSKMLGTHQNATLVLLQVGINQPTLRDTLEALGSFRIKEADRITLNSLLRRWNRASTKRNRLVHGRWMLNIQMIEGPSGKRDHTKASWQRYYPTADREITQKIFTKGDQKLRASHLFTLNEIESATSDLKKLSQDIEAFTDQLSVLPFEDPQPLELDQTSI
jgi:hypothetical protein